MKLEMENVSVSLSGKRILNEISLSVPQGCFYSILGASGCGKSTLLKTAAGLLPCDAGVIRLNGKNAEGMPPHKREIVIVFQDVRLFPHLSVVENIAFPLKMRGVPNEERTAAAQELLERVHLTGYAKRRPSQLSGGEQQRVALARALAARPDILLLDEPFSSLDENLRFDIQLLILELHTAYHMTTMMVTHDKEEALSMSDAIMVMESGRILCAGTPREVYETPQSLEAAKYFGHAAFIEGRVTGGQFISAEFILPCEQAEGNYTLMLRHDAVSMVEGNDFKVIRNIYTGRQRELLLRHSVTGLVVRCNHPGSLPLGTKDSVSLRLYQEKLCFFPKNQDGSALNH